MTKLHERLQRLERVRPSTKKLLYVWQDMDGSIRYDGKTWGDLAEILAAYPKQFDPETAMVFTWKGGTE